MEKLRDVHVAGEDRPARPGVDLARAGVGERAAGEAQRGLRVHRHIADPDVGAALRHHLELERALAFRRDAYRHLFAVDLRFAEELVLVRNAGRELRRAELHPRVPFGGEAESFAVHVVAVRDLEAHLHPALHRARAEAERLLRLEQLVILLEELRERRRGERPHEQSDEKLFHVPVSAATQSR